jgi:membrane-bound lytic murein transglycosylase D
MKNNYFRCLLLLVFVVVQTQVFAQQPLEVPEKLEFADIEITLEEELREKIQQYANKLTENPRYFRAVVERADAYFPIVERVLKEEGVPDDFKYLVIQESSLISDAVSSSNAVGFWQFKAASALEVGLRINDAMDERKNITASTRGAARYLVRNQKNINNWVYTLLSYYAGLMGAKSVMKEDVAGKTKMLLDKDTHWYITKFIAHKLVFENAIGRNQELPLQVIEYFEGAGKTLEQIAAETNLSADEVKFYNKWLNAETVPEDGRTYAVILPYKKEGVYPSPVVKNVPSPEADIKPYKEKNPILAIFKKEKLPEATKQPDGTITYSTNVPLLVLWNGIKAIQAREGDNISKLALMAEISRDDFLKYNDLRVFDHIVPGQIYYVKPKKKKAKVPFHIVQDGESLWEVSQNYGISIKALMEKNRMSRPEKLERGRVLWMRKTRPADVPIEIKEVPAAPKEILPKTNTENKTVPTTKPEMKPKGEIGTIIKNHETPPPLAPAKTVETDTSTQTDEEEDEKYEENENKQSQKENADTITTKNTNQQATHLGKLKPEELDEIYDRYILQQGENLLTVSKFFEVAIDSLMIWNGLNSKTVQAGQEILIKRDTPTLITQPSDLPKTQQVGNEKSVKQTQTTPKKLQQPDESFKVHTVQQGETLFGLAKLYQVAVDSIIIWNKMEEVALKLHQRLLIRKIYAPKPEPAKEPIKENNTTPRTHTVQAGQTLFGLAKLYNLPADSLVKWNKIGSGGLSVGQVIALERPKSVKTTNNNNNGKEHIVKSGETLYKIAKEYGVSVADILKWNNKKEATLSVGEKLFIPDSEAAQK